MGEDNNSDNKRTGAEEKSQPTDMEPEFKEKSPSESQRASTTRPSGCPTPRSPPPPLAPPALTTDSGPQTLPWHALIFGSLLHFALLLLTSLLYYCSFLLLLHICSSSPHYLITTTLLLITVYGFTTCFYCSLMTVVVPFYGSFSYLA